MIKNLFFFGDSVIDIGNANAQGNVPTGTSVLIPYFSNGIPFSGLVCNALGIYSQARLLQTSGNFNASYVQPLPYGNNYAYSGAHIVDTGANSGPFLTSAGHSLDNQVKLFLQDYKGQAPANSGAVVYIGVNDVQNEDIPTCMGQIKTILQSLLAANLSKVIVFNLPLRLGVNATTGTPLTNINLWNSLLPAVIAACPGAVLFDNSTLWQNVTTNPLAYGLTVTDINIADAGSVIGVVDDYLFFSALTHPSAAGHRIVANALLPLIASTYNTSVDNIDATAIANTIVGNTAPNPLVVVGGTPNAQLVTQSDQRLALAQYASVSPAKAIRWTSDFESATATPAPYTWVQTKTGSGGWLYTSTFSNTHGSVNMFVSAAADVTGQTIPAPYIMTPVSGKLDMSFRTGGFSLTATDQITVLWGLMDSISAPTNGMYFSINNNATVVTANFTFLKASAATTIPFTFPVAFPATIRVITDFRWQRAWIYQSNSAGQNVLIASASTLLAPPVGGSNIYPGFITSKIGAVAGTSYLNLDSFNITYFWDRS